MEATISFYHHILSSNQNDSSANQSSRRCATVTEELDPPASNAPGYRDEVLVYLPGLMRKRCTALKIVHRQGLRRIARLWTMSTVDSERIARSLRGDGSSCSIDSVRYLTTTRSGKDRLRRTPSEPPHDVFAAALINEALCCYWRYRSFHDG